MIKTLINLGFLLETKTDTQAYFRGKLGYRIIVFTGKYNDDEDTVVELYKDGYFHCIFKSRCTTLEEFLYLMELNKIWIYDNNSENQESIKG